MFNSAKEAIGCPAYRARLEDRVSGGQAHAEDDGGLSAHLQQCARCRQALEDALLAARLVRDARRPAVQPSEAFVTRVMAAIRERENRPGLNPVWRPLELLASRFALAAAVVLLALSVYLAEFGPARGTFVIPATTTQTAASSSDFPEPPAAPSTPDDVLISMAERGHGI
jgi:predicted anti-sigma-YlaC factor YlaD